MRRAARGFVIGELLVALLLLAVAVSSLAALMYSVSHRPTVSQLACSGKGGSGSAKCTPTTAAGGPSKLLRSGCATRSGYSLRDCKDTLVSGDSSDETILKARTDSASMALLARKQNDRHAARPDLGFVR